MSLRGLAMTGPDPFPTFLRLVCGSRSLVARPFGEDWARHEIDCLLAMANGAIGGDADGPDRWLREACILRPSLPSAFWCLDGTVQSAPGRILGRWCPVEQVPGRDDPRRRRWPLTRNEAMARALAQRARRDGRDAEAYGLIDPESPTEGTAHTLAACQRLGVPVFRRRFPGDAEKSGTARP